MAKFLALDLATRTGWALRSAGGALQFGFEQLPPAHGEDYGRLFNAYRGWLRGMIAIDRPDWIYFERAMTNEHEGQSAAIILIGLAAMTLEIAYERKVPWKHIPVSTVRKHFCGSGKAKKEDVGYRCRQLGYEVSDHNAADAIALLDYAEHKHEMAMPRVELFPEGRAA
jgi:Holliday junction resolvasome RuvABC endonuclease subunit